MYALTLVLLGNPGYTQEQAYPMVPDSMVVRNYNRGVLDSRNAYKFELIEKPWSLAERIKLGLERMQKNGEFNQLFYKHFAKDLEILELSERNIICLQSRYLAPNQQTCPKPRDMDFIKPKADYKLPKQKKASEDNSRGLDLT